MGFGSMVKSALKSAAGSLLSGGYSSQDLACASPSFEIKLNGKKLEFSSKNTVLTNVYVDYTVFNSAAGICVVTFKNLNMVKGKTGISVSQDFKFENGSKFELSMGHDGKNGKIFSGYVVVSETSIETLDEVNKVSVEKVICMDPKWVLMSGKKTNSHRTAKTYSAVVKSVLTGYSNQISVGTVNINAEPNASSFLGGYVACQNNESDFNFLKRLAEETGSLFYADEDAKLNFISIDSSAKPVGAIQTITQDQIIETSFKTDRSNIPKKVCVIGMDPKNVGKTIKAEVQDSKPIGEGKDSDGLTKNISNSDTFTVLINSDISQACAKFRASAIMNLKEIKFTQGTVMLRGTPGFKLGQKVKVSGGTISANSFLVTGIRHEYSTQTHSSEYITTLTLSSNRTKPIDTSKEI